MDFPKNSFRINDLLNRSPDDRDHVNEKCGYQEDCLSNISTDSNMSSDQKHVEKRRTPSTIYDNERGKKEHNCEMCLPNYSF